jgi:hypothetical protein
MSCSTSRKGVNGINTDPGKTVEDIVNSTAERNLTNEGFFINKGKISTSGDEGKISLYFTMKYRLPGVYLISLRSKTGIEAFRVYLNKDTVMINNRLNQTVLIGKARDFERISGIPVDLLKISVGDFFYNYPKGNPGTECINNEIRIEDYFLGLIIKTTIDCARGKPKKVMLTTGTSEEYINIDYEKFRTDKAGVPKFVEVYDFRRKIKIKISITKYSAPWYGDIKFIPGTGYDIKPLI